MKHQLIALTGYGRAGKDVLGAELVQAGYTRRAFGDIIKRIFDPLCFEHLGYSAFTTDPMQKEHIRPLLVHGGQAFYDTVSAEYFANLDQLIGRGIPVVNTRLFRPEEAHEWRKRGGVIWLIDRKDNPPAEPEEERAIDELLESNLVDEIIFNNGTLAQFQALSRGIAHALTVEE